MSSYARWGCVKIIEPIDSRKDPELVGGLKNAFERGESFEKAKQSFINAGYKPSEVGVAAQEIRKLLSSTNQSLITPAETRSTPPSKTSKTKRLPTTPKILPTQKKRMSKFLIIILILILISTIIGAAILGLLWDNWS